MRILALIVALSALATATGGAIGLMTVAVHQHETADAYEIAMGD